MLVVDDSVVVRRLVADTLAADSRIEVVGVAADGQLALAKVEQLTPDLVTMDLEMPVLDGVAAVRALRAAGHRMPIIMFSTLTERGAVATLDALAAGATDYVAKPSTTGSAREALAQVAADLVPRIVALAGRRAALADPTAGATVVSGPRPAPVTGLQARRRAVPARPRVVVLGSSTGGPEALARVLSGLPARLPVPVVVVQHMPPVFTRQLAARLDRIGPSTVVEAEGGEDLEPGWVYLAPGGRHLDLVPTARGARTRLTDDEPVHFCRPSVDVLFRSAVPVYGRDVLGVVLTGMGSDGRSGCEEIVAAGGSVLVQDEATSVVWGMPGSVAEAGLAHDILPIDAIGTALGRATGAPIGRLAGAVG